MKKIFYYFSIAAALLLWVYAGAFVFNEITEFQLLMYALLGLFLLIFGAYGLYAERLWKKFARQGKTENFCVEANYHVRKLGLAGKVFLFPFIKIKSSNSIIIALLGAIAWVIIVLIIFRVLFSS